MPVVAVQIIKKSRVQRLCCECRKVIPIGSETIRAYGNGMEFDPKYAIYMHPHCTKSRPNDRK